MSDAHARGAQLLTRETQLTEVGALAVTDGETALHAHERGDLQAGLHLLLVLVSAAEATELTRRDIGAYRSTRPPFSSCSVPERMARPAFASREHTGWNGPAAVVA